MIPPLHSLILTGGYSTRMGMDKCMIDYHGMPQHVYLTGLLSGLIDNVFISCRPGQHIETPLTKIVDTTTGIGPMAGLVAAFDHDAQAAWLLMACDMPLVDNECLLELMDHRDVSRQATYFIDPATQKPEPLLAIYERSIFPLLKSRIEQQDYSLNRLLQACDGNTIFPIDAVKLRSVNTKLEYEEVKLLLKK